MNDINYVPYYILMSTLLTMLLLYKIWSLKPCVPTTEIELENVDAEPTPNEGWSLSDPAKKGGSYSIYFEDKHIANVRGKAKATVLFDALKGVDSTEELNMKKGK